jgi:hypothetical protein
MGMTIESRSSEFHRSTASRPAARRKEASPEPSEAAGAERSRKSDEQRRNEESRRADERETRRAEASKPEAPARSPGSGVSMDNDMLVWIQSQ